MVHRSVLYFGAACCSLVQFDAVWCNLAHLLKLPEVRRSVVQFGAIWCSLVQFDAVVAVWYTLLQFDAV